MGRPSPQQLASTGTEDGHQAALFCHIANELAEGTCPQELSLLFAIPNGGARGDSAKSNMIRGGKLKQTGVKKGVPDTCWPVARGGFHGLYIELKRPKSSRGRQGTISKEQDDWHVRLREQGYAVFTAVGWEAALEVLQAYAKGQVNAE